MKNSALEVFPSVSRSKPAIPWNKPRGPHTHSVQFYEDDNILLDGLGPFVGSALGTGRVAIVLATKAHRDGLAQRLAFWGIDIPAATRKGRYIALDGAETLSKFMVDGWPDEERFSDLVGGLIAKASISLGNGQRPSIFGEMVALLWAAGTTEAAIRLEQLWNNVCRKYSFDLCCAYPIRDFGQESHDEPFRLICAEHSQVIPTESYMSLESEEEQLRAVSALQQKTQTLQGIADESERLYNEAQEEIARRTRVEETLRASERFSREILENSTDCLQVVDLDGTVRYTSPAAQRMLRFDCWDSAVSGKWMNGWTGEGRDTAFAKALAGGIGNFQGQCAMPIDLSAWWDVKICPMFNRNGQVEQLISISREITDLKQMQSALIQAEKLAAVGRLAATVAHELNNPLDAVTNLIYLAKISGDPSDGAHEYLEMADRELARVTHIAQQTLGFYRNQAHPVRVNLSQVVAGVLSIYNRRLKTKRLRVDCRVDRALELRTREGELKQVLSNLICNAIDASRPAGTIWVRARSSSGDGAIPQGVRITIADNGVGMPTEVRGKIFHPFFTTKGDSGTGIGLWVTRTLLEKQGGAIRCRSSQKSKTGTVMNLFLPNTPSS